TSVIDLPARSSVTRSFGAMPIVSAAVLTNCFTARNRGLWPCWSAPCAGWFCPGVVVAVWAEAGGMLVAGDPAAPPGSGVPRAAEATSFLVDFMVAPLRGGRPAWWRPLVRSVCVGDQVL